MRCVLFSFFVLALGACVQPPTAEGGVSAPASQASSESDSRALSDSAAVTRLFDVEWRLESMARDFGGDFVLPNTLRLRFSAEGKVFGFGGCNSFAGTWESTEGGALVLGKMAASRRFCFKNMEVETAFFQLLETVAFWRLEESGGTPRLMLFGANRDDPLLIFSSVSATPS
ncbi:MAG: META domain-containing protein [Zoogloeaceae bacterium]|jgi:heat shock protein HslJ|nr:META domain-containing protein [Zoogloeaceae bacterium]